MLRQKLRTSSGCSTCRARRKKCDEVKPACKNCTRLGKRCSYLDQMSSQTSQHPQESLALPIVTEEFLFSILKTASTAATRTADHSVWWQTVVSDKDDFMQLFDGQVFHGLASTVINLESVIISGVCHGWASLLPELKIPLRVIELDSFIRSSGHGIVARIISSWYFCLLDDYIATKAQSSLSSNLPTWFTARSSDLDFDDANTRSVGAFRASTAEERALIHIPWPHARVRMQRDVNKYCNNRFFRKLSMGTRFIWPFAAADAIRTSEKGDNRVFSAELLLRATNIRSFAVTKDFLDAHPEFRGEVPQFEPSVTWYQPEEQRRWEAVYWAKLRERRSSSKKRVLDQI